MPKQICLTFILSILLACCQNNKDINSSISSTDTIDKEKIIPYTEDSASANSRQTPFLQNFAKVLGLRQLTTGTEGYSIRIWVWYPDSNYVVTIDNHGTDRNCQIVEFYGKEINFLNLGASSSVQMSSILYVREMSYF